MNKVDIKGLADEAADEAIRYIQDHLGIPTGDFAGLYFSGDKWKTITELIEGYIQAEMENNHE
jgi:hypothetical protein